VWQGRKAIKRSATDRRATKRKAIKRKAIKRKATKYRATPSTLYDWIVALCTTITTENAAFLLLIALCTVKTRY
jgi:hypothetical protein